MRILITGTAGFIGDTLARHFADKGEAVLALDARPSKGLPGFEEVVADVLDRGALHAIFRQIGPEAVVHLAARTDLAEKVSVRGCPGNIDSVENLIGAPPIRTLPVGLARLFARAGDPANKFGFPGFPFNSLRLKNILTEYRFDLAETLRICGEPPYTMEEGVARMAAWYRDELA